MSIDFRITLQPFVFLKMSGSGPLKYGERLKGVSGRGHKVNVSSDLL